MDKGPCTPDAEELKRVMPEALQTECEKCSEKQKQLSRQVIHYLIDHKSQMWKELSAKYDPDGIYFAKYKDDLGS
jgi:phage-related protein